MDEGKWALLTDFGLARMAESVSQITKTGVGVGTPAYMSPEQGQGLPVDRRTDVYSLGVVLYEMVTGRVPYEAETPMAIVIKHITSPLPLPRKINPNIPEAVERVILKALAKEPGDRFDTAGDMVEALEKAVSEAPTVISPAQAKDTPEVQPPVAETLAQPVTLELPAPAQPVPEQPPESKLKKKLPIPAWMGILAGVILVAVLAVVIFSFVWKGLVPKGEATSLPVAQEKTSVPATSTPFPTFTATPLPPTDTVTPLPPTDTPKSTATPTSTLTHTPIAYPPEITQQGATMVLISAGAFQMGCDTSNSAESCQDDEKPLHTVTLDAYYIDRYEVTNALYQACEEAGECTPLSNTSSSTRSSYYGNPEFADYPVIFVNWEQARKYCAWRGARLPTEAEWEKAARGDQDTRTYPWGDQVADCTLANYGACKNDTDKVGSYPGGASPYGVLDMAGNVWEWVNDWYDGNYYNLSPASNPPGPETGQFRVLRGGGWSSDSHYVRSATRTDDYPDDVDSYVGFRCASPPGPNP